jgi:hypothetical protein
MPIPPPLVLPSEPPALVVELPFVVEELPLVDEPVVLLDEPLVGRTPVSLLLSPQPKTIRAPSASAKGMRKRCCIDRAPDC